ncbi:MAG: EutN/CcmL family microcompartment protein [Planctomycetia bacterium]|nr:EutN/CcmL family microcompartment protein [Planctomycetia bacterium]
MQVAEVVGHAVASVKHASMKGWRLLIVQPLTTDEQPDGEPFLAIDSLGSDVGSRVLLSSDGKGVAELVGSKTSPIRWFVMGLCDE